MKKAQLLLLLLVGVALSSLPMAHADFIVQPHVMVSARKVTFIIGDIWSEPIFCQGSYLVKTVSQPGGVWEPLTIGPIFSGHAGNAFLDAPVGSVGDYFVSVPEVHAFCRPAQKRSDSDPLFSQMIGHWIGTGTCSYSISGRVTQLSAVVDSTLEINAGLPILTSKNQMIESEMGQPDRSYSTVYWMAPAAQLSDSGIRYVLGGMKSDGSYGPVNSEGLFSACGGGECFHSDQNLGSGDVGYIVHSSTHFESDGSSTYTETMTQGGKTLSSIIIHYVLAPTP